MIRKTGVLSIFAIIIVMSIMPAVLAGNVLFRIKTGPGYEVSMNLLNPVTGRKLPGGTLYGTTDNEGIFTVNHTTSEKLAHISFIIKDENKNMIRFKDNPILMIETVMLGKSVFIDLTAPNPVATVDTGYIETVPEKKPEEEVVDPNETVVENLSNDGEATVETIAQDQDTDTSVTGEAILGDEDGDNSDLLNILIYSGIGFLVFVIILFIIIFIVKKSKKKKPAKGSPFQGQYVQPQKAAPQKVNEQMQPSKPVVPQPALQMAAQAISKPAYITEDQELADAESKLMEAQKEISNIKDKKRKISEAKKKLESDRAELEKLKGAQK
ncbi:DUF1090 domain-containing protein [Candidatus Pacearchaeota archaeon]|nr:DUF1090 domain-containing protein [Candidatus Pacearchaeota archaeon]